MASFEELGLEPELVEGLIAEGIEVPTALQSLAIPLLRRGNPAILRGGPGAGTLLAYGIPLLDRLTPGIGSPVALVFVPTRDRATALARSLGRIGLATGHRCAALAGPWALPGRADILFCTPADLEEAVRSAEVKVEEVNALVLDGAGALLEAPQAVRIERLLEVLPGRELQITLVADPLTPEVRAFADDHVRRAVFLPPEAAGEDAPEAPVDRGTLRVVADDGAGGASLLVPLVTKILEGGDVHHVLIYFRNEDAAADAADDLLIHGYMAGTPGDPGTPVWLGLDPLEARRSVETSGISRERIVNVSAQVPPDVDVLDRRHGGGRGEGMVLAASRELPHLRRIAREAGYRLEELRIDPREESDPVLDFRRRIEEALVSEDLGAYLTVLEPLFERWTGAEVAAALAAIQRKSPADRGSRPGVEEAGRAPASPGARPPAWARLFLSVGTRDGVGPGDLLGAITGEAGLEGSRVGRIDIRDTFSKVEVEDAYAHRVIKALNGITIRGRSVRADFDRGEQRRERGGPGREPPRGRQGRSDSKG